jgi:hypothetical protein
MLLALVSILGLISVWSSYFLNGPTFYCFIVFFLLSFLVNRPQRVFSPTSVFYAYYAAWFILAPLFATRYVNVFLHSEYNLAIAFAYTVFCFGLLSITLGIRLGIRLKQMKIKSSVDLLKIHHIKLGIIALYIMSSFMVIMIILSTGGFEKWIKAPGDAFLERAGSGIYVILSHFLSITLAALVGYLSHTIRKKRHVLFFMAWVFLTSPVHGSKLQISLLIVIVLLPWIRTMKLISIKSALLSVVLVSVFLLGLYFRNMSWISFKTIIPYSLNYFSALENLAISIRDFSPQFLTTFFLPFVKFQTPFGLAHPNMYYDMNHYLTDIYLPSAWKIRATEQWPVETDLYLNFMFFGGLPLLCLYLIAVGFLYGRALKINSLGHWVASLLMSIFLISHLRGSLFNHIDFYMYPFIICILFIFKDIYFKNNQKV